MRFKRNTNVFFYDLLVIYILAAIALLIKPTNSTAAIIILSSLSIFYALYYIFKLKIVSIEIKGKKIILISKRSWETWRLEVEASKDAPILAKFEYRMGARGGRLHFLNISQNQKSICRIDTGDGWSRDNLDEIKNAINALSAEQID